MQAILLNGQLRLHRNPLFDGVDSALLLWCWPRRASPLRQAWLAANLAKAQQTLRQRGADLFVLEQRQLPDFLARHGVSQVRMAQPLAPEEAALGSTLGAELAPANTLFDTAEAGATFSQFKKSMAAPQPRSCLAAPPSSPLAAPTLAPLPGTFRFEPGEEAANERLLHFVRQHLSHYKASRNGLLGDSFSSQLSAYLAEGLLAIDHVWQAVHSAPAGPGRQQLLDELLWREFFHHWLAGQGARVFTGGPKGARDQRLKAWQQGQTGLPLVDAAMRELLATGYMSNRARQNAASFLVHDLGQDWRAGADWFEQHLLDYQVSANWGNWAYIAGHGANPRAIYFDVAWQSQHYDPDALYLRHWLPELAELPTARIHRLPWLAQRPAGYPAPVGFDGWGFGPPPTDLHG
ncbi:FAD-binding domain-containing protein [Gallaecimonas xiamenensis]|uniref:DASH family cryptochrome n=1 Tax=Gallaecimonas xiamenensis 3-C-1 TaxID=745411 RepID=K2JN19_9GAMM|nr:FAD-binding domain-containing protein [Gallaecimonas xiamenensis]EKE76643.1 DASH family cryptochrome [Gallaecimonas xiamenensis 3-C-1]